MMHIIPKGSQVETKPVLSGIIFFTINVALGEMDRSFWKITKVNTTNTNRINFFIVFGIYSFVYYLNSGIGSGILNFNAIYIKFQKNDREKSWVMHGFVGF